MTQKRKFFWLHLCQIIEVPRSRQEPILGHKHPCQTIINTLHGDKLPQWVLSSLIMFMFQDKVLQTATGLRPYVSQPAQNRQHNKKIYGKKAIFPCHARCGPELFNYTPERITDD